MTAAKIPLYDEFQTEFGIDEMEDNKSLTELNIYDLMGEDHSVWLTKNKRFGYDLHVENLESGESYCDKGIHNSSIDSMADFCRAFLACYQGANR